MDTAQLQEVAALYDSAEGHVGNLIFDGQVHWGYWDEANADASLAGGADRLTEIMIQKTTIQNLLNLLSPSCLLVSMHLNRHLSW